MTNSAFRGLIRRRISLSARAIVALGLVSSLSLAHAPSAAAQASVQGQWQTLQNLMMPINPIHAALLHNGKVLIVSGSGNLPTNKNLQAAIFDPVAGTITTQPVTWDMFCNGMVVLADGRAIVTGGTLQYDPFHGQSRTTVYDPATGQFTDVQAMAHGRWYPSVTNLSDGTVMTYSGLDENGNTNSTVEIYTVGSGWSTPFGSPFAPPLYPRMLLLPSGQVFYSGSTPSSRYFDPVSHTWSGVVATTNYSGTRTYGSSVLLPLTPANNYKPVVMIMGGGNPATNTTELIDLSAATPSWVKGPNMTQPRIEMNATILPNGKVIALGGSLNDEDTTTASLNADLYDPATNLFTSAGQNAFARLYHSNSLLLPDATVLFIGGNPARGTYEQHIEIYSPAYLFNADGSAATRPSITGVPSTGIGYGSAFQVQTPDAAKIASVVLMRAGAPTHSFDMEQRMVALSFTAGSGVLNVTAPPNGNIAPLGYYMLFLLNAAGVPSVAQFVRLSPAAGDVPPTGVISSPSTNVTITAGQSVFFDGSASSDPDGTISAYSWTFPGGSPSSSALATPGNVTYTTAGSFNASLTVTDNANLTDPNPPTRTITVNPVSGANPPALLQHASKDAGITNSSSLAFPGNNSAGNWIAVVIRAGKSGQVFTVSDSLHNTYHAAVQFNQTLDGPNGETLAIYYAENIAGGANAVTVSDSISNNTLRFAILEYSGVATSNSLDVTAAAQGSGTTLSSGSATTNANGDLILGLVASADGVTFTAGPGFVIEESVPVPPSKVIAEDAIQTAAGPVAASATLSTFDIGGALMAAFKAAVAGGPLPASITATAGSAQSTTVNTAFATQLQATVKDASNNPVSGVVVTFTAPASGASGTFAGGVNTATTNASGVATSATFAANSTVGGPYNVVASATGATSANFSLTNTVGAAAKVGVTSGSEQSATISTAFGAPLVATVTDSGNNPVSGVVVTFTAPASGASGTFAGGVNTATTNASGVATSATFTANSTAGGPYNVVASATGATPANFSLTNTVGAAAKVAVTSGSGQSTPIGTAFGAPLVATVTDSGNNPVSGVVVTFTAPASGASGTFAGGVNTATTNASGVATSATFTANSTAGGPYAVAASVSGVATPANFSLTNTVGAAAKVAVTSGSGQSTPIGTAFGAPLVATVTDSGNNPVSGVVVTFTAPASGASGTFAGGVNAATTNASGVATSATFTANSTVGGPYNVVASATGATSANFSLTNLAAAPAKIVVTSGSGQSATISTAFGAPLVATVTDSGNNPVSGVVVTFIAPASGASGTFAGGVNTATTNASGVATSATFTANSTAGGPYAVAASVSGVATSANFSLTNTVGAAAKVTVTSGSGQSATISTAFGAPLVATVTDSGNNPVSGVVVTLTAPASGASGTFAGGVNAATTNASGVATSATFTANSTAGGPYAVAASVSGVATPANFSLTNTVGAAAKVAVTSGTGQSATISTAFGAPLVATVTDSGNPVSGVVVTFTAPASGASGTFAGGVNTATTNAGGIATSATFTANSTAGGPYNVVASATGATPANFSLTNTAATAPTITLVQHTSKDAGITNSSSLAFPGNNSAGNWIAVVIRAGKSGQGFTVSDSLHNTYHTAVQFNQTLDGPNGETLAIYYAENIAGGANAVTVSDSISNNTLRFAILEYSGVATSNSLDVTAAAQGSATTLSSGSATTTANGDLILGLVATADAMTFTAGSGFTIEERVPSPPSTKVIAEDAIQTLAGPIAVSASLSASDNGGALLAAFKHR